MYQDYRNLIVRQKAMDPVQEVYRLVKLLPSTLFSKAAKPRSKAKRSIF